MQASLPTFDPNAAATTDSGIFGLPYSVEEAKLVLIPVPWEVTTSYGGGTSQGPQAILQASKQIDLFDRELGAFYEAGIAMQNESADIQQWNATAHRAAQQVIQAGDAAADPKLIELVNETSVKLNQAVYAETKRLLAAGKKVGLVGGDHSTPFGAIQAFVEQYPNMGILHIDAHADLRCAFEGFEFSHASIMYNVLKHTELKKLVQVGIRDFCEAEHELIKQQWLRVNTFFDADLAQQKLQGKSWASLCDAIIKALPMEVYISFDIDGLDPRFCPHTGTPVPGGLDFQEVLFLFKKLAESGRRVIGFDLNEVAPDLVTHNEWDANVGARLLYKLCGWTLQSS